VASQGLLAVSVNPVAVPVTIWGEGDGAGVRAGVPVGVSTPELSPAPKVGVGYASRRFAQNGHNSATLLSFVRP
jgi:hypothetical protein